MKPATNHTALARQLSELAEAMESLADKHTERLDYEGYSGLVEHAAELKAIARLLAADDLAAQLACVVTTAEEHLAYVRELFEEGGAL